jgi:hypothetical protein
MNRRQRCRNPKCPCVEHQTPPKTTWHSAEGVPPLPEPLAGFVHRRQDEAGAREVYFRPLEPGTPAVPEPLPDTFPATWAPAIDRAHRFLARKAVQS